MALSRPSHVSAPSLDPNVLESAARDVASAGAITFLVDNEAVTYAVEGSTIRIDEGQDNGDVVVRLSRLAWDDMVDQVRTVINLLLSNDLAFERGGFEQLADWDPILRYLHAGIPPYDPARADFHGRDPRAVFTLDASDDELAAQLQTMGYLHVKAVFDTEEMQIANREIDRLAAEARPGDEQSWWVTAGGRHARPLPIGLRDVALTGSRRPGKRPQGAQARHSHQPHAARGARPHGRQRGVAQSAG